MCSDGVSHGGFTVKTLALIPARSGSKGVLLDMSPCSQMLDGQDGWFADAECASYDGSRCGAFAYNHNLLRLKLGESLAFASCGVSQAKAIRMEHVFSARAIFQVSNTVVEWLAVEVVDFLPGRAWAYEGSGNELMDTALNVPAIASEIDSQMSTSAFAWTEYTSNVCGLSGSDSSYTTHVGHFIPTLYSDNRPPFFLHGKSLS